MFTDIVDSTRLVEMLGDEQWESLLAWHDRTLRACFEALAGEEVKHEGDGFFVAFAEPRTPLSVPARSSARCAITGAITASRLAFASASTPPKPPTAAATTAAAECTTTARIAAAAGAGEIIASREALEAASDAFRAVARATTRVERTRRTSHRGHRRLVATASGSFAALSLPPWATGRSGAGLRA